MEPMAHSTRQAAAGRVVSRVARTCPPISRTRPTTCPEQDALPYRRGGDTHPAITYVPIGDARDDEQARPAESPQDAIISAWRRRHARGDVIIVRRADDFIVGFEHEADAQRFLIDLREWLVRFGLELHPTRRGRSSSGGSPARIGRRGPRETGAVRLPRVHAHLRDDAGRAVLGAAYHGLDADAGQAPRGQGRTQGAPTSAHPRSGTVAGERGAGTPQLLRRARRNRAAVATFPTQVTKLWHEALERRSQRTPINWARMDRVATRWLTPARVMQPFPDVRFRPPAAAHDASFRYASRR